MRANMSQQSMSRLHLPFAQVDTSTTHHKIANCPLGWQRSLQLTDLVAREVQNSQALQGQPGDYLQVAGIFHF